ncbi:MAG: 50S ribosomal protein L6 [Deltaproteobacteria bacterium]|nr:50S ribosomal protein L6 [Deltaproteobacteria bacterium]
MSRIGKLPIAVPAGVRVALQDSTVQVEGPKGGLSRVLVPEVEVEVAEGQIRVRRRNDERRARALHGLTRTLLANMVQGVTQGFEKVLEIGGVGYRADVQGRVLNLSLGFSHPVRFPIPEGIQVEVERQTTVRVRGIDKELVGQTAAKIRAFRPPDPYKAKGVRYSGEQVRRKVGKAGAK